MADPQFNEIKPPVIKSGSIIEVKLYSFRTKATVKWQRPLKIIMKILILLFSRAK